MVYKIIPTRMFFEAYILAQGRLMGKKTCFFHRPQAAHQKPIKQLYKKICHHHQYLFKPTTVYIFALPKSKKHIPKQNFIETSLHRGVKNRLGFPSKLRAFEFQPCPQPQKRFHHHVLNPWLCSRVSGFLKKTIISKMAPVYIYIYMWSFLENLSKFLLTW